MTSKQKQLIMQLYLENGFDELDLIKDGFTTGYFDENLDLFLDGFTKDIHPLDIEAIVNINKVLGTNLTLSEGLSVVFKLYNEYQLDAFELGNMLHGLK